MKAFAFFFKKMMAHSPFSLPIIPYPSPNFDERPQGVDISWIILHYTDFDNAQTALDWLCDKEKKVSAHYLLCREGAIYQLVADEKRAWHAGVSHFCGEDNFNHTSIGIELDNNGHEPYAKEQISTLLMLLNHLCMTHNIPRSHILGHNDIAPTRKIDPGPHFPWENLHTHGFGGMRRNERR